MGPFEAWELLSNKAKSILFYFMAAIIFGINFAFKDVATLGGSLTVSVLGTVSSIMGLLYWVRARKEKINRTDK